MSNPPRRTAREGVMEWLVACANYAHPARARITNTTLITKGRDWMLRRGYKSYSANNLTRRFLEIRQWDTAPNHGITVEEAPKEGAESAWLVARALPAGQHAPTLFGPTSSMGHTNAH